MSGKKSDIIKQLLAERFQEASRTTFYGTVLEVNETQRTCRVGVGNIEYDDVLLYAIEDNALKGWVLIPAKNSRVLVSRVDGSARLYVSMFSVVDKMILTTGKSLLRVTPGGITVKRDKSGLKKTLTDLLSALEKLTVPTAVGPSGIPVNIAEFTRIKQELNNYLEE